MMFVIGAGQDRLHFKTEGPPQRRKILSAISAWPVTALVFESRRLEPDARQWAIGQLLFHLSEVGGHRLVIEAREDSLHLVERQGIKVALDLTTDTGHRVIHSMKLRPITLRGPHGLHKDRTQTDAVEPALSLWRHARRLRWPAL
jgi:hypothetical protein